jgi:hypothetical protein
MIRPEIWALALRSQEVIFAAILAIFGLWMMVLGGYVLTPIGGILLALAASMGVLALRRLRFSRDVGAFGVVEVDEAQIGYFGPSEGGFISLQDMIELRLLRVGGVDMWRLKQSDGQTLLIPVGATGADRLFDAFAALPNMNSADLVASLAGSDMRMIWQRTRITNQT